MNLPIHDKKNLDKKDIFSVNQGSNTQPYNYQIHAQPTNQFMFHDNSYTSDQLLSAIHTTIIS